ncbi:hypothetical protein NEIELOOT_02436 [Neisseria elongata subsp. glycolytica ATCC 29315]|uniref:Uncharacterized protein n=1 Tax=Neisseria elongata subsp. glycolytica ATCC 29315 TaxID=546263 RepID=D4DTN0_NEIEG|nr:hypothetical protein NEIELOOT_02436 [Neisseria elongata subsp. glycolytica ATCC 29315]
MGGADLFCGFLFRCAGAYRLVNLHAYADLGGSFVLLWQRDRIRLIWPLFLGLLTACWWPLLDWYAVSKFVGPGAVADTIVINKPWFASWTFKIVLALVPTVAAYAVKYKHYRNHRHDALID